jgi:hypothetical protein
MRWNMQEGGTEGRILEVHLTYKINKGVVKCLDNAKNYEHVVK